MFNKCLINSRFSCNILWTEKNPNWNIKVDNTWSTFLKDLAKNLIHREISRRKCNLVDVLREAQLSIELFYPVNVPGTSTCSGARKRCHVCPLSLDRKQKQHCLYCKANISNEHSEQVVICHNCIIKNKNYT